MIRLFRPFVPNEIDAPLLETLHSGMITQGPKVEEFEKLLGDKIENPNVVTVNSGTTALTLALKIAGVGPGTEVISTPMTCAATNLPVANLGGKVVWADVDPITGLVDPRTIPPLINDRTRAILTVDWGGDPVDYRAIREIKDSQENFGKMISFVSDAAHSFGATHEGKPVGSLSHEKADMTCFSFQAIKTITTVDGGAISFRNPGARDRAKLLRWFGIDRDNNTKFRGALDIPEAGFKYHMNDINATIGIVQLGFLDRAVARQATNASLYKKLLDTDRYVVVNTDTHYNRSAHWLQFVLLPSSEMREKFRVYMQENDIEVSQVHWRNDRLTCFGESKSQLPGVDAYSSRMIAIPVHHQLTELEVDRVITVMNGFMA